MILILIIILFLTPACFLLYGWFASNFSIEHINNNLDYPLGLSGFEALPKLDFEVSGEPICGDALYLGSSDVYEDCSAKCSSGDYEYKFLEKNHNIIVNNKKLAGAYCLTKPAARCNLNTSVAIIGLDGFKCVSRYPGILGGESGNLILACNGSIYDKLTHTRYDTYIPNNLTLTSFDEKLENGDYRFICVDTVDNHAAMVLPKTVSKRLESDVNVCGLLEPTGSFDESSESCKCFQHINGDTSNICSSCVSGFAVKSELHGSKYGLTVARDCIDPTTASHTLTQYVQMPCGEKTLQRSGTCQYALLLATTSYTPMALENIFH